MKGEGKGPGKSLNSRGGEKGGSPSRWEIFVTVSYISCEGGPQTKGGESSPHVGDKKQVGEEGGRTGEKKKSREYDSL